jgi:hypothetical protein
MPLQPSDEELYRAVINLQADPSFKVVRSYIGRRHLEEMSRFHALTDDMKIHKAQGRDAEILELYNKVDPTFARTELEKLIQRANENQASQKLSRG